MFGIDMIDLITKASYIGLFAIVFAESGLFFGFFLPGDSLLFTAGLLCSTAAPKGEPILNVVVLIPLLFVGAVLGDTVGYWFGAKTGPLLFKREDTLLFKRRHLLKAKTFYEKHGGKTITLARFVPIIRTFAPIVAGAAEMHYRRFLVYNLVGGLGWTAGMTLLGYFLGGALGHIEGIEKYFTLLVLAFFFIPGIPTLVHLWRENRHEAWAWVKKHLHRKPKESIE